MPFEGANHQGNVRDGSTGSIVPAASLPIRPSICTGRVERTSKKVPGPGAMPAKSSDTSWERRVRAGRAIEVDAIAPDADRSSTVTSDGSALGFCSASARNAAGSEGPARKALEKASGEKIGSVAARRGRALRPSHAARRYEKYAARERSGFLTVTRLPYRSAPSAITTSIWVELTKLMDEMPTPSTSTIAPGWKDRKSVV